MISSKDKQKRNLLIICTIFLVLLEIIGVIFIWNISSVKTTMLDDVKLRDNEKTLKGLAIMVETENDDGTFTYKESDNSSWPTTGYKFNSEKSGCLDSTGNKIENSLKYDKLEKIAIVDTGVTSSCYLYFDIRYSIKDYCISGEKLGECLITNNDKIESLGNEVEAELYRFKGTNGNYDVDDNYICFGTTSKEDCINGIDTYMYRIIGVEENGSIKIMKRSKAAHTKWYETTYTTWENSTAFNLINTSIYDNLGNWKYKILNHTWYVGDVGSATDKETVFLSEKSRSINANIGMVSLTDYYYAYSEDGNWQFSNLYSKYLNNWIHLANNGNIETAEWVMTRCSNWGAWLIYRTGAINSPGGYYQPETIRTTFFLKDTEQYISGDGTIDNPIIIGEPEPTAGETLLSNSTTGLDATTPYSGMYRYIGTTANNYVKLSDGTNEVLYRIIGIVSEDNDTLGLEAGQLKLIKAETTGNYNWHGSDTANATWNTGGTDAAMYTYLQGSSVLGSTSAVPSRWLDKISSVKWNVGDINTTSNLTGSIVYSYEDNAQTTNISKMGLMYLSDYFYAYTTGGETNCYTNACTNWLTDTSNITWTMTRYGYYSAGSAYTAWRVLSSSGVSYASIADTRAVVRPVFYLTNDVYITNTTATGSSTEPFILDY